MRWTIALTSPVLALLIWGGAAFAAGPSPGSGPWVACANDSIACELAFGAADTNTDNEIFDCTPNNGRPGRALQHSGTGAVKCWAL